MTCTFTKLPGGFMVTCTRGQRSKPCKFCGAPATKLCDAPLRGPKAGQTCSAPMCNRCAREVDFNFDLCPPHARDDIGIAKARRDERAVAEFAREVREEPFVKTEAYDAELWRKSEARAWLRNLKREEDAAAQSIGSKVEHVRRAVQSRDHGCHWPGCDAQVPPAMWGCRAHWFTLPKEIRDEIWRTYRAGQEDTLSPSSAYLEAADRAQAWIAEHEAKLVAKSSGKWERAVRATRDRDRRPKV